MAQMTTIDDFRDEITLQRYLARQLRNGRLSLVLGAGLSVPFGLPDWETLVKNLFELKGSTPPAGETLERSVEYFKRTHYPTDGAGFIAALHKALYKGVSVDFAALRSNLTLAAIGSLVMASRRGSICSAITFNFDNLLELFLRYHGFVTSAVISASQWGQYSDVSVFHPHGFVPFNLSEKSSDAVVLDQHSYSSIVGNETNPWRQLVLSSMRRATCIFIGLSGDDRNLDSILQAVKEHHATRCDGTAYWGVTFSTQDAPVAESIWRGRGVYYMKVADYAQSLPTFLFGICQEAAKHA